MKKKSSKMNYVVTFLKDWSRVVFRSKGGLLAIKSILVGQTQAAINCY